MKILNAFFVTLGVVFFVLILISAYVFVFDPFHLKPLFEETLRKEASMLREEPQGTTIENQDKNALLSPTQEKMLETFGINPATLPSSITPEQESCFVEILGQTRVNEIKAGATPTVAEFISAKECI